ncbi:FMN-dependent NADH-azoreductase [Bacillus safensis]|uniref:FMN-dependent NADH-azoreductase n=1 Tax=Bacillus safensis TaxID=561879 RepID=UPI0039B4B61C
MSTLLYITAHPSSPSESYSLTVGEAFISAYQEAHPEDRVVRLDLYKTDIPQIDQDVIESWAKLQSRQSFDELQPNHQKKLEALAHLLDQFCQADKYVFVNPMWNFSHPPVMKAYIDAICMRGKTFQYTEHGPIGLLNNKKAIHIQACGGIYTTGPQQDKEIGSRHLQTVLNFIGVTSFDKILVEGMSYTPHLAEEIKTAAVDQAKEKAKVF